MFAPNVIAQSPQGVSMMKLSTLLVLVLCLLLLLFVHGVHAASYGVRSPAVFNSVGCAGGTCGVTGAPLAAPPVAYGTSFAPVEVARTVTVDRTFTQCSVEVQEAPAVLSAPVYAPARFRAPVYGYSAGFGVAVRAPRVAVDAGFGGTAVRVGRVAVNAAPGQFVDVRRGGLRGVLFGTRVRVR